MKLAVSNLAFPADLDASTCAVLFKSGVRRVEVAPTKLGDWASLTRDCLTRFRNLLSDNGLSIPSLQAVLFNVDNAHLLKEEFQFFAMSEHIRRVVVIASTLGAGILVFGAPKQRARGELNEEAAVELGAKRLSILAKICADYNVTLALEPVPAIYGSDFLQTWQEVKQMVERVQSRHLAVHLDTACVLLGKGDIGEAVLSTSSNLKHFHIAEPQLNNFRDVVSDHRRAAEILQKIQYNEWLAIEMLGKSGDTIVETLEAVEFVKSCYACVLKQ